MDFAAGACVVACGRGLVQPMFRLDCAGLRHDSAANESGNEVARSRDLEKLELDPAFPPEEGTKVARGWSSDQRFTTAEDNRSQMTSDNLHCLLKDDAGSLHNIGAVIRQCGQSLQQ